MAESQWSRHKRKWSKCQLCPLWETRKQVVLARGQIPCDVLILGEAPGASEDIIGQPFIGPAGKLLDQMLSEAGFNVADYDIKPPRLAFTNLIACVPLDGDGSKTEEPPRASIHACNPRLVEFVRLAQPKMLIRVGALAGKHIVRQNDFATQEELDRDETIPWLGKDQFLEFAQVTHPAAILRASLAQRGLMYQRAVVVLRDALDTLREKFGL